MVGAQDENMAQAIAPQRPDQALNIGILPRDMGAKWVRLAESYS